MFAALVRLSASWHRRRPCRNGANARGGHYDVRASLAVPAAAEREACLSVAPRREEMRPAVGRPSALEGRAL